MFRVDTVNWRPTQTGHPPNHPLSSGALLYRGFIKGRGRDKTRHRDVVCSERGLRSRTGTQEVPRVKAVGPETTMEGNRGVGSPSVSKDDDDWTHTGGGGGGRTKSQC